MYRGKVINKGIVSRWFKVIDSKGNNISFPVLFDNPSRNKHIRLLKNGDSHIYINTSYFIIFNANDIYKGFPKQFDINLFDNNSLGYSFIPEIKDVTKSDLIRFYVKTCTDLSYETKRKYLRDITNISKRRLNQFDKLFSSGVSIDLMHKHGGDNNRYCLYHISDKWRFGVKWLAGLFGFPYGATLSLYDPVQGFLKFDSSGLDTGRLYILDTVFRICITKGKRGKELLKSLGKCRLTKNGVVLYDYHNENEFRYDFEKVEYTYTKNSAGYYIPNKRKKSRMEILRGEK